MEEKYNQSWKPSGWSTPGSGVNTRLMLYMSLKLTLLSYNTISYHSYNFHVVTFWNIHLDSFRCTCTVYTFRFTIFFGFKFSNVTGRSKIKLFCMVSPISTRLFCYITCIFKRPSLQLLRFQISRFVPFCRF